MGRKPTMTHSQLGQDNWILSNFDKDYKGFFVEIGAADGKLLSNSLLLEENNWTGICVEPEPGPFKNLKTVRTSDNYNYCILDYDGVCKFKQNGLWSTVLEKHTGDTPCITLLSLLKLANAPKIIDYLSIDVEGSEYDIIREFPFDDYFIKYLTIEHNANGDGPEKKNKLFNILSKYFIRKFEDVGGFEDWYINKKI
jgi:FkbM family methyltransferase